MDYEVTCTNITVAPCPGADPNGALHENRRQWPLGSVVRLAKDDADSLVKAGAVKVVAPTPAQAAMAAAATAGLVAPPVAAPAPEDGAEPAAPRTRGTRPAQK